MSTLHRLYTVDDLETFPDDGLRYEIIGGELIVSPSPSKRHQRMEMRLSYLLVDQVELRGIGWVYSSPVDVRFSPSDQVQPDLLVLLAEHDEMYRGNTIHGAPDLVIEIVSPGSQNRDREVKFGLYERNGVPEYWLADPMAGTIRQYALRAGRYEEVAQEGGLLRSTAIPGLVIDVPALSAVLDTE
jgi:Uma2 family endonuclease